MELKEKVRDGWNHILEHPRRYGFLITFPILDYHFGFPTHEDIATGITPFFDSVINMGKYFLGDANISRYYNYMVNPNGGTMFHRDLLGIGFSSLLYYPAVKINRTLSLLHTKRLRPFIKHVKDAIMDRTINPIKKEWRYFSFLFMHKDSDRYFEESLENAKDIREKYLILAQKDQYDGMINYALDNYRNAFSIPKESSYEEKFPEFSKLIGRWNPIRFPFFLAFLLSYFPEKFLRKKIGDWKGGFNFKEKIKKIKENPEDLTEHINVASNFYFRERTKELKKFFRTSTSLNKSSAELRFFYALISKQMGQEGISQEMWEEGIDMILEEGINFERMSDTRNEVMEYGSNEFFKNLLVFKRSKTEEFLKKDYVVNKILWNALGEEDLSFVPEPLEFLYNEKEGKFYCVSRREELLDLESLLKKGEDLRENISYAIGNLAYLHRIGAIYLRERDGYFIENEGEKISLPLYSYMDELNKRFMGRLERNEKANKFSDLYAEHLGKLRRFTFLCHGDFHLSNVLEFGEIVDFEKATVGNPSLDLADLIESFGKYSEKETSNLIYDYYYNLSHIWPKNEIDIEQLLDNYFLIDRIQSQITDLGSKVNRGKLEEAQRYALRISNQLGEISIPLRDSFLDYLHSTNQELLA